MTASENPCRCSSLMRCNRSAWSVPYQRDAALAAGRREELALLVEADRVDGDVGAAGELLDPDLGVADRGRRARASHEWRF